MSYQITAKFKAKELPPVSPAHSSQWQLLFVFNWNSSISKNIYNMPIMLNDNKI